MTIIKSDLFYSHSMQTSFVKYTDIVPVAFLTRKYVVPVGLITFASP